MNHFPGYPHILICMQAHSLGRFEIQAAPAFDARILFSLNPHLFGNQGKAFGRAQLQPRPLNVNDGSVILQTNPDERRSPGIPYFNPFFTVIRTNRQTAAATKGNGGFRRGFPGWIKVDQAGLLRHVDCLLFCP